MMLNAGLMRRAWMETRGTTIALGLFVCVIAMLLNFVLPRFQKNLEGMQLSPGRMPMIPPKMMESLNSVRSAMLGTDVAGANGREIAAGIAWSHPFFLAIIFAHGIAVCTRVAAGEIDKGTMDVLLGLPVSRWEVFLSESVVWIAGGVGVIGMGLLGSRIGNRMAPPGMTPDLWRMGMVAGNLLLLYTCIGSFTLVCAAIGDRRMRAVAIVVVAVIASLVLNYLGLLWEPAKKLTFLSFLYYYRPILGPLVNGRWIPEHMAALGGASVVLWVAAGVWFARRDLSTT